MLNGSMFIIDDIMNANLFNTIIVDLNEDTDLEYKHEYIIKGTLLLPPVQAMIAESDGNEKLYDEIYINHLLSPKIRDFIGVLIACMYHKGMQILFYLSELGYNNTETKFADFMYKLYGIHPGIPTNNNPKDGNFYCDPKCVPMWLGMMYMNNFVNPYEFLQKYPIDAFIPEHIMTKLINEINPFGVTLNDKVNTILKLHKISKTNIDANIAIFSDWR